MCIHGNSGAITLFDVKAIQVERFDQPLPTKNLGNYIIFFFYQKTASAIRNLTFFHYKFFRYSLNLQLVIHFIYVIWSFLDVHNWIKSLTHIPWLMASDDENFDSFYGECTKWSVTNIYLLIVWKWCRTGVS